MSPSGGARRRILRESPSMQSLDATRSFPLRPCKLQYGGSLVAFQIAKPLVDFRVATAQLTCISAGYFEHFAAVIGSPQHAI